MLIPVSKVAYGFAAGGSDWPSRATRRFSAAVAVRASISHPLRLLLCGRTRCGCCMSCQAGFR